MIAVNQNLATISAPLAGSYGFAKYGAGTLVLTATNSIGGGLTVNGGSVNITAGSSTFGNGTCNIGFRNGSGNLAVAGGNLAMGGELRVGAADQNGSQYIATGTVTLANAKVSVGALTLARGNYLDNAVSGTLTLNSGSTLVSTNDVVLEYAGTGLGKLAINGGDFIVGPTAAKWLIVGYWDSGAGELDITNGNLLLENGASIKMCRGSNNTGANVVNQFGGAITFYSDGGATAGGGGNLDLNYAGGAGSRSTYNLNGGTLTVPQIMASSASGSRVFNFNGGTLRAAAGNSTFMASAVATAANVRNGGAILDTAGFNVTIGQTLQHSAIAGDNPTDGGLTKKGNGILTLTGANTWTGNTTVSAGTLELAQPTLNANSVVSIATSGGASLQLAFTATNRIGALLLNGILMAPGVYNSSTSSPWLTGAGSLQVPIATTPTNIAYTISSSSGNGNGTLMLSWPADHTGWRLQAQTNTLPPLGGSGLGTNWFDVPGSPTTNTVDLPIDPSNGSVFYRLIYP